MNKSPNIGTGPNKSEEVSFNVDSKERGLSDDSPDSPVIDLRLATLEVTSREVTKNRTNEILPNSNRHC